MTDKDLAEIRERYRATPELDARLYQELRSIAHRLVRFGGLPASYSPYGQWNEEAENEVFQGWMEKRLLRRGQLQALLDKAKSVGALRKMAERSLRQYLLNERERSQAQNLYWRMARLLEDDEAFFLFREAKRPQDCGFGLASWTAPSDFAGTDRELLSALWRLGNFRLIVYAADARKLSPLLDAMELRRFVVGMFEGLGQLLTLSQLMRALELRFDLGETKVENLEEAELAAPARLDEGAALRDTGLAIIAELSARQVEVLLGTAEEETLEAMARRFRCSAATIHNEQTRIAVTIRRFSGSGDEEQPMLKIVRDLLYEEDERR